MNQIFFFCQRIARTSRILFLSPDEPDEPDGWRNVMSGSSGLSGDDLYDSESSCCPCYPLAIIISVGKKIICVISVIC